MQGRRHHSCGAVHCLTAALQFQSWGGGAPFLALGEIAGLETPRIVQLSSRELPGKRQTVVRASLSHCLPSSYRPVLRTLRKASERPGKDPIP